MEVVVCIHLVGFALKMLPCVLFKIYSLGGYLFTFLWVILLQNALGHVHIDIPKCTTINRACSSVKNVVQNVAVCLLDFMEISRLVLATKTGRPSEVAPSAHERNASALLFLTEKVMQKHEFIKSFLSLFMCVYIFKFVETTPTIIISCLHLEVCSED
eukprot:Gb_28133 [translate_table: standard]